jgi:hypothetical protein
MLYSNSTVKLIFKNVQKGGKMRKREKNVKDSNYHFPNRIH